MKKEESKMPTILIDTREQAPYNFSIRKKDIKQKRTTLHTGDYSLEGFQDHIAIERKSKADIYGTISELYKGKSKRFLNELERLSKIPKSCIVIECTWEEILFPPEHTQMQPSSVINTLISWSLKYNVKIFAVGCRKIAENFVFRVLEKSWKQLTKV